MHVIYCIDIDTREMSVSSIYDIVLDSMSTSLPLTKWPPNFRMILICYFFSTNDVSSSTTKPEIFIHASTLHFGFRISIFYFSDGEIAAPIIDSIESMLK